VTLCVASVTSCRVYNLLNGVDHGGPPGLLHESAYIPTNSWRALVAQVAKDSEPSDHPEALLPWLKAPSAPDRPETSAWQVCYRQALDCNTGKMSRLYG
jgi:hypothetical protein